MLYLQIYSTSSAFFLENTEGKGPVKRGYNQFSPIMDKLWDLSGSIKMIGTVIF